MRTMRTKGSLRLYMAARLFNLVLLATSGLQRVVEWLNSIILDELSRLAERSGKPVS